MGKQVKVVNKINRKKKDILTSSKGFDQFDKMTQAEEKSSKSQGVYKLLRKIQRKLDKYFGIDAIAYEERISKRVKAVSLERFDFDLGAGVDFGMKLTMAAGMIAAIGLRPGDIVRVLHGSIKGKYLKVVALSSATEVRLEDVATYGASESNIHCRFQLSDVKSSSV